VTDKHSSLFCRNKNDKQKSLMTLKPGGCDDDHGHVGRRLRAGGLLRVGVDRPKGTLTNKFKF